MIVLPREEYTPMRAYDPVRNQERVPFALNVTAKFMLPAMRSIFSLYEIEETLFDINKYSSLGKTKSGRFIQNLSHPRSGHRREQYYCAAKLQ